MKKRALISAIAATLGLMSAGSANAFSISLVADNDFAIFSGTSTSINNILYQNNVSWYSQVANVSTLNFVLPSGDNMFYVLGMGGGGPEDISGEINGVNITSPSVNVLMSQDISSFLTGYNNSAVENGTFNASLSDVQTALTQAVWSAPTLSSSQPVIQASGFGSGFSYASSSAHLFAFAATDVQVVPAPASLALLGLGLVGLVGSRRRKAA